MFSRSVIEGFMHNAKIRPHAPALFVQAKYYSYAELKFMAQGLANQLRTTTNKYCVIFSGQSLIAYVGILAAILANKTYVPITHKIAANVREHILTSLKCCDIVVDQSSQALLRSSLQNVNMLCSIFTETNIEQLEELPYRYCCSNADVYLLFTSGTTGFPKGIQVTHRNLSTYMKSIINYFGMEPTARVLHINDLSFDISAHEIFYAWGVGGCLYAYSDANLIGLPKFIKNHALNVVTFVPSVIALLKSFRSFNNIILPDIKITVFAGEALPQTIAKFWHAIAPNSSIDNLYGPTEATVLFTRARWSADQKHSHNDLVPIGNVIDAEAKIYLLDAENNVVPSGCVGEMALAGAQIVDGYWRDLQKTAELFVNITVNNSIQRVYKTGDLAVFDPDLGYIYKGRNDDQLQIRGVRTERLDIESALRKFINCVALSILPSVDSETKLINGFTLFIVGSCESEQTILRICRDNLASHMQPDCVFKLGTLPINKNGKVNLQALEEILRPAKIAS